MRLLNRVFVGAGLLAAVAACEHGDPVSSAGGPSGKAVLLTGTPRNDKLPGGSAAVATLFGGFTTNIQDAFGRRPTSASVARLTRFYRTTNKTWRWRTSDGRNASAARLDPRLPLLESTTAQIDPGYFAELYPPEAVAADMYEFYGEFSGLKPNTLHEIAFVHYRLTVNGQLDHSERILTGTVTQPDQLATVSGTLARIDYDWSSNADCAANAPSYPAQANPFVVGRFTSDADGYQWADKCWKANNGLYKQGEGEPQAKSMIGRSDDQTYDLPNYNYLELWEGPAGTGKRVLRVQLAQDLNPGGAPIANAYPAFPAPNTTGPSTGQGPVPAVDAAPSYPLSDAIKATLPGAVGAPQTVVATLTNLQRLEAPVYKAWFINPNTGAAKEAVGTYSRQDGATVENVPSTSTFKGGRGTITFTAAYSQTTHGAFSDSLTFFLITREDDPAATTPSAAQVLWVKIFKIPPANAGGTVSFGNFNRDMVSGATPPMAVGFAPQGLASGGILGEVVHETRTVDGKEEPITIFVGSVIQMQFTNLQRPPKGYEYLAYLRFKRDTTEATPTTVEQDSVLYLIGGPVGPSGESLANADVAPTGGNLGPQSIKTARVVFDAHSRNQELCNFDRFRLYLVPKGGVLLEAQSVIFDIPLPDRVTKAFACR